MERSDMIKEITMFMRIALGDMYDEIHPSTWSILLKTIEDTGMFTNRHSNHEIYDIEWEDE
jgi:hypothetical protein